MSQLQTTRTVYTVAQFLDWQHSGVLELQPVFQRRHVWGPAAKSQLINSVVLGYPVPIVFLRQVQNLDSLSMKMEVVDGQQRIRSLLSFIAPESLKDFDDDADSFTIRKVHNKDLADLAFAKLPSETRQTILGYELSTHVFPATTGDELIFRLFALLNSTGLNLTKQEIRNAEYHGAFKSLVYDLSFQCLDKWRSWRLFSDDAVSRMNEAEAVSEYLMAMVQGVAGKRQPAISKFYRDNDDDLPNGAVLRRRFEYVIEEIDIHLGTLLPQSAFQRPALFYSLFSAIYSHMYGLASPLKKGPAKTLPVDVAARLKKASRRIRARDLPDNVQDAVDKATGDKARRLERHKFLMKALALESAQ